jgi:uncharacterized protein DUF4398
MGLIHNGDSDVKRKIIAMSRNWHSKLGSGGKSPASYRLAIAAFIMVFLAGCSMAKPPTDTVARAELSARAADEAKAEQLAPVDYKNAREKLAKAKLAIAAERYDEARRLAESAQVDAELAEAKAEAEIVRRAADQLWKKSEVPATQAEIESRKPITQKAEKE